MIVIKGRPMNRRASIKYPAVQRCPIGSPSKIDGFLITEKNRQNDPVRRDTAGGQQWALHLDDMVFLHDPFCLALSPPPSPLDFFTSNIGSHKFPTRINEMRDAIDLRIMKSTPLLICVSRLPRIKILIAFYLISFDNHESLAKDAITTPMG